MASNNECGVCVPSLVVCNIEVEGRRGQTVPLGGGGTPSPRMSVFVNYRFCVRDVSCRTSAFAKTLGPGGTMPGGGPIKLVPLGRPTAQTVQRVTLTLPTTLQTVYPGTTTGGSWTKPICCDPERNCCEKLYENILACCGRSTGNQFQANGTCNVIFAGTEPQCCKDRGFSMEIPTTSPPSDDLTAPLTFTFYNDVNNALSEISNAFSKDISRSFASLLNNCGMENVRGDAIGYPNPPGWEGPGDHNNRIRYYTSCECLNTVPPVCS